MLIPADRTILSVARLTSLLQDVVEENFVDVLVEGEVSNLSRPASGHCYFVLKDTEAQLRAVLFRTQARTLPFELENGLQLVCRGRVSLYRQRGELQLVIESCEPSGQGGLQLAFDQLKQRLAAEGLFAEEHKQTLPTFPRTVGVVTSATGAAVRDVLKVLERRGSGLRILLSPVRVQGDGAAAEIAAAIEQQNRYRSADVLIVGRGGGSLEDLWAFNEEPVVRAVHRSKIPVISAVGHETDVTLADLAADVRAPTPSVAAELVVKHRLELESHLDHLQARLRRCAHERLTLARERYDGLRRGLRSPVELLHRRKESCTALDLRLRRALRQRLESAAAAHGQACGRLQSLSPLATLARGYAIVEREQRRGTVTSVRTLSPGATLRLRLADGALLARVSKILSP